MKLFISLLILKLSCISGFKSLRLNHRVATSHYVTMSPAPVATSTFVNKPISTPSLTSPKLGFRWRKASKQLATLGPASNNVEMIEKLFLAGVDVFRLNFSHGEHSEKAKIVDMIRSVEAKYDHPIGILGDLQGPKLRVGTFEKEKVILVDGQTFKFDMREEPGDSYRVRLPHPEILNTLRIGDTLLLDDGKLRMKVTETTFQPDLTGEVTCEVINGGMLSNRKGVNTPSIVLPISPLTPKDRKDLDFMLTLDVDWVALSFVQKPEDIEELKELVGGKLKVMAKLEKPSAIDFLDEIVDVADGIMVARGDLGVEMNPWDVPVIQKRIVETCKYLGKPVVVATQMLESMIDNPTPTRAEASDCATAIFDSADAVMLSAESAAGKFPVESVTMQQRIIERVETDENYHESLDKFAMDTTVRRSKDATTNAMTLAARQAADLSKSKALLGFTSLGGTVLRLARLRPNVPILAVTYDIRTARWLSLVWGVYSIVIPKTEGEFNFAHEISKACAGAVAKGFADESSDLLTLTAGLPWGCIGTTNVIRIVSAAGPDHWFDESSGKIKHFDVNI